MNQEQIDAKAAEQQAKYRAKCTARRNGKTIERLVDGTWKNAQTFGSIAAAKRQCRHGQYYGSPMYVV